MPQMHFHAAPRAAKYFAGGLPRRNAYRSPGEGEGLPKQQLSDAALHVAQGRTDFRVDSRLHSLAGRIAEARLRRTTLNATGAGGAGAGGAADDNVCRVALTPAEARLLGAGPPPWCTSAMNPSFLPAARAHEAMAPLPRESHPNARSHSHQARQHKRGT